MAVLHVKSPNGTTHDMNLDNLQVNSGGLGWGILPNGLIIQGNSTEVGVLGSGRTDIALQYMIAMNTKSIVACGGDYVATSNVGNVALTVQTSNIHLDHIDCIYCTCFSTSSSCIRWIAVGYV